MAAVVAAPMRKLGMLRLEAKVGVQGSCHPETGRKGSALYMTFIMADHLGVMVTTNARARPERPVHKETWHLTRKTCKCFLLLCGL